MNIYARIGAVFYLLWGLLHLNAARMAFLLGQSVEPGMIQGRLLQNAWNLLFFTVFSIVVAILYNWKNDRMGYWLNLIVVTAADIGFIAFVLIPGHAPMMPGAIGPLLWILAVIFSTIGILGKAPRQNSN